MLGSEQARPKGACERKSELLNARVLTCEHVGATPARIRGASRALPSSRADSTVVRVPHACMAACQRETCAVMPEPFSVDAPEGRMKTCAGRANAKCAIAIVR